MFDYIASSDEADVPLQVGRTTIVFHGVAGTYAGTSRSGRQWFISPATTGWRLEFRDHGDTEATYAGTHASVTAARTEACR